MEDKGRDNHADTNQYQINHLDLVAMGDMNLPCSRFNRYTSELIITINKVGVELDTPTLPRPHTGHMTGNGKRGHAQIQALVYDNTYHAI